MTPIYGLFLYLGGYMDKYIKVGVGVVILDDNKVLLGHRVAKYKDTGGIYEPDSWTLPGGKQEYSETIIGCAKRETKEETDLDISNISVFGADDDISPDRHFITVYTYATIYKGTPKVMEKDKIDEWKWYELDKLPENIYSPSKKTLKLFLEKRGNL